MAKDAGNKTSAHEMKKFFNTFFKQHFPEITFLFRQYFPVKTLLDDEGHMTKTLTDQINFFQSINANVFNFW